MNFKKYIIGIISIFVISGCTNVIDNYTIMSNKNINYNKGEFVVGKKVVGSHSSLLRPDVEEALNDALKDHCTVALQNATIKYRRMFYILFGVDTFIIEGDAIYDKTIPGCENK